MTLLVCFGVRGFAPTSTLLQHTIIETYVLWWGSAFVSVLWGSLVQSATWSYIYHRCFHCFSNFRKYRRHHQETDDGSMFKNWHEMVIFSIKTLDHGSNFIHYFTVKLNLWYGARWRVRLKENPKEKCSLSADPTPEASHIKDSAKGINILGVSFHHRDVFFYRWIPRHVSKFSIQI